jgi:hypothetical protein
VVLKLVGEGCGTTASVGQTERFSLSGRKHITEQEIAGVLRTQATVRYSHFIGQVADWGQVWGLRSAAGGWVSVSDASEVPMFPVWPHEPYARLMAVDAWADAVPTPIDVCEWIQKWAPGLAASGHKIAVFPTPQMKGVVADPQKVVSDLQAEIDQLERLE